VVPRYRRRSEIVEIRKMVLVKDNYEGISDLFFKDFDGAWLSERYVLFMCVLIFLT
jgi:hypothetical protein